MSPPSEQRSVKIGADERTGWSSDRPRRDGAAPRPREADMSTRCRVLRPSDRVRYSPGSLVVLASASAEDRDRFADRVLEDKRALLSAGKVRALLQGRVADEEIEARTAELLDAAVLKRLQAGDSVVLAAEGLGADERDRFVRMAFKLRRPRHLVLLETGRDQVADEDRPALNELRKALDAGDLGAEGFQTALRLGGGAVGELKRIVFRPPPADD
jgi:hypothetical protein